MFDLMTHPCSVFEELETRAAARDTIFNGIVRWHEPRGNFNLDSEHIYPIA